jgi:hypothetical protein
MSPVFNEMHLEAEVMPSPDWYVPEGQVVQKLIPDPVWKVPAGHCEHFTVGIVSYEKVPGEHRGHTGALTTHIS